MSAATTVVQARQKGVRGYRAIGRGGGIEGLGNWGNPYRVGDPHPQTGKAMSLSDVLTAYEIFLRWRLADNPSLQERFLALRGQTLGCPCPGAAMTAEQVADQGERCHGHVMVRVLGEMGD